MGETTMRETLRAIAWRAFYTFLEAFAAVLAVAPVTEGVVGVDWPYALNVAALAAILSGVKSALLGLPEATGVRPLDGHEGEAEGGDR